MNQVITDVPFGEGEVKLYLDTSSGDLEMETGELETPDLTLTTDYDTARKIFVEQDQAAGMQAFMAGKIKVQGDMMKMMAMQTGMPQDDDRQDRLPPRSRASPSNASPSSPVRQVRARGARASANSSTDHIESRSTDAPRAQLSIKVTLPPCTKNVSPVNLHSALDR